MGGQQCGIEKTDGSIIIQLTMRATTPIIILLCAVFGVTLSFECNDEAKIPGIAFQVGKFQTRPNDYKPAHFNKKHMSAYQKRQEFVQLSESDRDKKRRVAIDKDLKCSDESGESECIIPGVHASLLFGEGLTVCRNCRDAHLTGSFIDTWDSHYGPVKYHIDGKIRVAVPNDGSSKIRNKNQIKDSIALVFRCNKHPILEKVLHLQDAGAAAVIVMDREKNGCEKSFQCGVLGTRPPDHLSVGFGAADLQFEWRNVHIPVVLIHHDDGQKILRLLDLEKYHTKSIGEYIMVRETEVEILMRQKNSRGK